MVDPTATTLKPYALAEASCAQELASATTVRLDHPPVAPATTRRDRSPGAIDGRPLRRWLFVLSLIIAALCVALASRGLLP